MSSPTGMYWGSDGGVSSKGEAPLPWPQGPRWNRGTIGQGDNKRPKTTNPQGHQGPGGCPGHLPTAGSLPAHGWPGEGWFSLLLSWMLLPREVNLSPGVLLRETTGCPATTVRCCFMPSCFLVDPGFVALLPFPLSPS